MNRIKFRLILGFILTIMMTSNVFSADRVYSVGVVPQFEARRLASIWHPILDHLSHETGMQFELKGAPTIADFEKAYAKGAYDFVYMNPYHLIVANKLQGYLPLVKDLSKKLRGVLVVNKSSGIKNVKELNGKEIAFPSPNALGAALQMRQELHDNFDITFTPRYVKTHDSVYLNVILKKTAAGGGVGKTLKRQSQQIQKNLIVIHKTLGVSPHPLAVHPDVPEEVAKQVQEILLMMGKSEKSKKLLAQIPIKEIGHAILSEYKPLEKMGLERFYVKPK